ncbi:MAG: DNA-binding protein WhiA [Syntrophomonadaceae bacterium]|nr:DNA-binding protein WhiA [Syntrophomonadaceae bacterium]
MSFSADVRNELARIQPEKVCCSKAELSALLLNKSSISMSNSNYIMAVETDNPAIARKIYKFLKDLYDFKSTVKIVDKSKNRKSRSYIVNTFLSSADLKLLNEIVEIENNIIKPQYNDISAANCCKRAYLRGLFLSRGFINRPEGNYHLELIFSHPRLAREVQKTLIAFGVEAKLIKRKKSHFMYVKESEQIADFLRIVEANNALLEFENIRILKSMRNNVNRQVNCETANLAKTINAAVRQMELIEKLVSHNIIDSLPYQLKELAILRLDHPDATLKELGEMLDPPLTKSGVAYRMRRLEKFAEELLNDSI